MTDSDKSYIVRASDDSEVEVDGRHVDRNDALFACDPEVGQGTPLGAPDCELPDDDHDEWTDIDWLPSRKWTARTLTALTGLATAVVTTNSWDREHSIMAITLVMGAIISYILPNEKESA